MNDKAIGQLSGLSGRLVAEGLITAQEASNTQKEASLERMHFVQYLVEKKNVDGGRLAEVAGEYARFGGSVARGIGHALLSIRLSPRDDEAAGVEQRDDRLVQTTDVEGEINGLMTYDRKVIKIPAKQLAELHEVLFQ